VVRGSGHHSPERPASLALGNTGLSTLGLGVSEEAAKHPGRSGVELLRDGVDAFAMRVWLLRNAERSIDLQYYIWHDDLTGHLLFEEVRKAADRGVRVRLLLDDNGIAGLDDTLGWLDRHANVEIRLFNPFRNRRFKPLDFLFDFSRANRRMLSKSFTVDNQITIVGGRNIGDEYFAARDADVFADLDAICAGPVVTEVSDCFDRFWNYELSRSMEEAVGAIDAADRAKAETEHRAKITSAEARSYMALADSASILVRIATEDIEPRWVPVRLVSDPPDKVSEPHSNKPTMFDALTELIGEPEQELLIVSGYFVPTKRGAIAFADMARHGVDVRILTNSYASTDVGVVHAGYAPHRKTLVAAGVQLFEMPAPNDRPKVKGKFIRAGSGSQRSGNGSTLHAKAFTVDGSTVFIGSFNFDPRSFDLNTELGIVIESAEMGAEMRRVFDDAIAPNTYRVVISEDGKLGWIDTRDDEPEVEFTEPGTTWFSRLVVRALSHAGLDRLL